MAGRPPRRIVRWTPLAAVLAIAIALTACSSDEPKAEAPASPRPVVWGFTENLYRDPPTIDRKVAGMTAVGARMVRMDLDVTPEQERAVRAARAAGLLVMGVVTGGSRDPAEYADRMEEVVRTYAPMGVHHYEIWNEPNLVQTWPTADDPPAATAEYMAMVKAAYPRIKAADPRSTVLVGALSRREFVGGRPNDWVAAMYDDGLEGNFDAISVHPYTEPELPGETTTPAFAWQQMTGPWDDRTPSVRELMVDHGDGDKTVWITEFGAPTGGGLGVPVSEERQAQILARATQLAQTYPWLGGLLWYSLADTPNGGEQFGLVRADGSAKPALAAYRAAIARTRGRPAGS